jgi:hypothetical protein
LTQTTGWTRVELQGTDKEKEKIMAEHNAPLTEARLEKRRGFTDAKVTLNGERAKIGGIRNPFAMVSSLESGLSAEWSWETVEHVLTHCEGKFRS